jgi:Zn finger protein HypA/HybF involved in hydrogenase expression
MRLIMLAVRCWACRLPWSATSEAHRAHRACPYCGSERWEVTRVV